MKNRDEYSSENIIKCLINSLELNIKKLKERLSAMITCASQMKNGFRFPKNKMNEIHYKEQHHVTPED